MGREKRRFPAKRKKHWHGHGDTHSRGGSESRVGRVVDEVLPVLAPDAVDGVAECCERLDARGVVALGVADVRQQRQTVWTRRALGAVLECHLLQSRERQKTPTLGTCCHSVGVEKNR